jgi:hypothetical protein
MIFHCTKKAQDFLGLAPKDLVVVPGNDPAPLTAWYVNVFTIDRRRCLHVTEAATFYTCTVVGVRKDQLRHPGGLIRDVLLDTLRDDGLPTQGLREQLGMDSYAKTVSRQVLGVMNEQAAMFEARVAGRGGLILTDISKANVWLNGMIVMPLKMLYTPRRAMMAALKELLG